MKDVKLHLTEREIREAEEAADLEAFLEGFCEELAALEAGEPERTTFPDWLDREAG